MKNTKPNLEVLQRSVRTRWIAVGDASRFVVFRKDKGESLVEVKAFTNETAHLKISDLTTGKPGRSFDSFSKGSGGHQTGAPRHAYTNEQDPKAHAVEMFVRKVSAYLERAANAHSFDNLVLVMDGRLLGQVRSFMSASAQEYISETHDKNFAWLSGSELESKVEALLALS